MWPKAFLILIRFIPILARIGSLLIPDLERPLQNQGMLHAKAPIFFLFVA